MKGIFLTAAWHKPCPTAPTAGYGEHAAVISYLCHIENTVPSPAH
jgi:hypothetical protein